MDYFNGVVTRVKVYPIAVNDSYITRTYKREHSRLGRLYNDIEYKLIRWIFR